MNPASKSWPASVPRRLFFSAVRSGAWTAQIGQAAVFLQKHPRALVESTRSPSLLSVLFSKKPSNFTEINPLSIEWKSRKNPSKAARRSTGDAARRRTKGFPAPVTSLLLGQLHLPHPGPPPYPAVGPREESRLLPRRPREMPASVLPSPAYVPSMAVPCGSGGVAEFHPGVVTSSGKIGRGGWCS